MTSTTQTTIGSARSAIREARTVVNTAFCAAEAGPTAPFAYQHALNSLQKRISFPGSVVPWT